MKAAVYRRYGPPEVVTVTDVPKPVPNDDEVLVRVVAATVSTGDWRARSLALPPGFALFGRLVFGLFRPRKPILGTELSGIVESVGSGVTRFRPGDAVFAYTSAGFGAHAEYRAVKEAGLIQPKPANLSFAEAAALSFGGTTALGHLRDKAHLKAGDDVLVVGASGSVGSAAVAIARHYGARVTGVSSAANGDLVRSLGAWRAIDYRTEDFAAAQNAYDIILDTTGTATLERAEPALKPGGRLSAVLSTFAVAIGLKRFPKASGKRVISGVVRVTADSLRTLADLAAAGEFRPVIDRIFPLAEAAQAHAYVETGRKRGNVVLEISPP